MLLRPVQIAITPAGVFDKHNQLLEMRSGSAIGGTAMIGALSRNCSSVPRILRSLGGAFCGAASGRGVFFVCRTTRYLLNLRNF